DGIETLKEMKDITGTPNSETPVVCLTANAISGMREMYISAGFDDYLTKPIDPDRLETLLLQYIPKGKIAPAADEDEEDDYFIPDFIFKLDDLDVNSGLIHCGSRESYMVTLKMYLDAGPKNADDIEKYWNVRDLKNTTVKVHALKSTSRVIGALKLGDFAARLEKAGDSGDTDTLEREIGDLLTQYRELVKKLEPLRDIEDGGAEDDRPLISEKDMKEAYTALEEFCASFDYDSVVNIVESLENYRFPEEEATRFDAVKKAVDNFDYDLIPGILSGGEG
ncbi:MAG: Hpt domain-containing protein, partial [Lachnospiraceae bacterium]|nr:Hpt domain-containing protein [Lachnospiraceae bacterium]